MGQNTAEKTRSQNTERASTGIAGLDDILGGGLPKTRLYLVEGDPGSGKTTLALQFLLEGLRQGETGLYVTLSETKDELIAVAESHGWNLDQIAIHELSFPEDKLSQGAYYTFFHPSEVELSGTTQSVLAEVERVQPVRVVFDSLSEMRLLARDPLKYRRQILGLKQFFIGKNCTVMLLDDRTAPDGDLQLQSLAHGVVMLEQLSPLYGAERRRLRVIKLRGVKFRGGFHDFTIKKGGLEVYPRLIAAEHPVASDGPAFIKQTSSTGLPEMDRLLGGGLNRGTSTLIMGPAGSGKSALASQQAYSAAQRGEKSVIFTFDESMSTLFERSSSINCDLRKFADLGLIHVEQIDPAERSPGEFIHNVREAVQKDCARTVIIDSLNGYLNSMPEENFLVIQLHELLNFLNHQGVVTILVVAQHGLLGTSMESPVDVSYLADTVILLRYFEVKGSVRKAVSVVKKRYGAHEETIREYAVTPEGLRVGEPLTGFHGVLSGIPQLLTK